jgi:fructose-bisphosphate aldolase class I
MEMERHTVNTKALEAAARKMVADGEDLLAIDESTVSCNKHFAKWGIPQTAKAHWQYRELIVDAPVLAPPMALPSPAAFGVIVIVLSPARSAA